MKKIVLGKTRIETPQNAFGALPIQRRNTEDAVKILRKAYERGITFFDTARAYTDSEEKIGLALSDVRKDIFIASKTMAKNLDEMKEQLEITLNNLKTDYLDIYQFHLVDRCISPGDGSGMYEYMEQLKADGVIKHIGITAHKIGVAEEIVTSGLYETLQFPFSYLSGEREEKLVEACKAQNMGFIAMKALAGGLITDYRPAFAYMSQFDNVLPIWGIQREEELEQWLSCMTNPPSMTEEIAAIIEADKKELDGDFCRGCGYCLPCPAGIEIPNAARMALMVRRAPVETYTTPEWKEKMKKIENCIGCNHCKDHCPYGLDTPNLLKENLEDYKRFF